MSWQNIRFLLTLVVASAVLAVPSSANADSVRLYEHANLRGAELLPQDKQPDYRKVKRRCFLVVCGDWNDRVSSLHVPAYTCVTLYEHINYTGPSREFCGDTLVSSDASGRDYLYVGDPKDGGLNDQVSSSATYGRRTLPTQPQPGPARKFDLLVRTYNQWAPGSRMGPRVVEATRRFAMDSRDVFGDAGDMGIIASQEGRPIASGVGGECPYAVRRNSSHECVRAALSRAYPGARPEAEWNDGLGITWDGQAWENIGYPIRLPGRVGAKRIVNLRHVRWELPPRRVRHCRRVLGSYQCGPSTWPKSYMMAVRLRNRRTGVVMRVFNLHMAANMKCDPCDPRYLTPSLADNSDRRLAQARIISQILQQQVSYAGEAPFVITGDFNFDPTSGAEPQTQTTLLAHAAVLRRADGAAAIAGIDNVLVGRSDRYPFTPGARWDVGTAAATDLKRPPQVSDHGSPAIGLYLRTTLSGR